MKVTRGKKECTTTGFTRSIIIKSLNATYELGERTYTWLKLKPERDTIDCTIVKALYEKGKRAGFYSSFLLAVRDPEEKKLYTIGKVSNLPEDAMEALRDVVEATKTGKDHEGVFVKPSVVVEATYQEVQETDEYTSGYALRVPKIVRFRHDKRVEDIDSITGATYTTRAVAESVLRAGHTVAEYIGLPVTPSPEPKIIFGVPEIVLLGLFAAGYIGHQRKFKYKKQIRWASILIGMIVLGFVYNSPLTLAYINKFLLGYWPQWRTHLYWYLLIGGILFVFTVDNKNPYCEWFCPFGAAQDCMGVIGGAKPGSAGRYNDLLLWVQRGLAWLAIVLALYFRNPGLTSFEVFGTLFDLTGSTLQFALLGIILIASLFIKRPWCKFICPMRPVMDLYRTFRKWMIESWRRLRTKATA